MTENNPPEKIQIDDWIFRIKQPLNPTDESKALLLLHGYLGNENVMWVLTNPIPKTYFILSPRAPVQNGPDQFSWHEIVPQWPDINTYKELIASLMKRVDTWAENNQINIKKLDVMGFSQGAVMAYALALIHPEKIGRIAALAGFIPSSWKKSFTNISLANKPFFIAHGTRDDMVSIDKAYQAVKWLKEKGADVTFCEADTGHKLSANCFNGLGNFFR